MKNNSQSNLKETVFTNGSEYFRSMIKDMGKAKKSINLETYIFRHDHLGIKIAEVLMAASQRGIEIRIVVDGAGSPSWGNSLTRKLEKSGVKSRVFHPFPWRFWQWSRSIVRWPLLARIVYLFFKVNSRNHRKVCMIDDKIVYIGSSNITKSHLTKEDGGDNWHDAGIKIEKADLSSLKHAFEAIWDHRDIQERIREIFKYVNKNPVFRLNNSWHRRRILYKNLLKRISRCRKRIWITNSYFVPDHFLLKKLRAAAEVGVDVRILLPRKSDVLFMPWASTAFYRSLLKAGVRIYEYLPSILHAKTLILDDWYIIGSSNLNHRSLFHDLEVDVNIRTEKAKAVIERQYYINLEQAQEIRLENWIKRPLYQRFFGRLCLYAKYWI